MCTRSSGIILGGGGVGDGAGRAGDGGGAAGDGRKLAPGEDEVGALSALGGLSDQQEVWQQQAWQGGSHAHSQEVGSVVHVRGGPSTGHLGVQGERLGPRLSPRLLRHPQPEPPPQVPQLPCVHLGSNSLAPQLCLLPPHPPRPSLPPGHRELGTWTKLLSNMGSGRRGMYSPFWRVFCSSPRVGTHFAGPWNGSMRLMFQSRFMAAAEMGDHRGMWSQGPSLPGAPQPTGLGPLGFTGGRSSTIPEGGASPGLGHGPAGVVSPGLGEEPSVEGLCDLIGHRWDSSWELPGAVGSLLLQACGLES